MDSFFIKRRTVFLLIFAALMALFVSCSQNTPELTSTDYSVIFDYEEEGGLPSSRLSVFAASSTDVRRYQKIRITSLETGLSWEIDNVSKLESEDTQWAGYANLTPPENQKLPTGLYEITYYNADEKECSVNLEIKYDVGFYDVLLSELADFMKDRKGIEKIAVYDKDHILIYFGDRSEDFQTTRTIWNRYREARYYQIIWYSPDGSVICIEPERPVLPENEEKE